MRKHLCTIRETVTVAKRCMLIAIIFAGICMPRHVFGQSDEPIASDPTDGTTMPHHKKKLPEPTYPKVVGYLSFIVPVVTVENSKATANFASATSIGFPTGINVLYSSKFGFSFEFTPTIKAVNGSSKMSNLLFDPGPMFRFKHGFTIIPRLAFETSGRYGFTPVFNEVYLRTKDVNYFVALSLPARWGTDDGAQTPGSLGLNVQFGFIFN